MNTFWQYVVSAVQIVVSLAGLTLLFSIARSIGAWEQWRKWAEEQIKSTGKMLQEQGNKISEILGRLSK